MAVSDGALWDYVHTRFGIGDFDESLSTEAFYRYRALEVHKLRKRRAKLKVSTGELVIAADYCAAHRLPIRDVSWLYKHLGPAKQWHVERAARDATSVQESQIDEAIAHELAVNPDGAWVDRLVRARGDHRVEVYQAWRTWLGSNAPPEERS